MRSGDAANVRWTPRAASASATASAGSTWPAVPPAAITHRSSTRCCTAGGDVKEDADGQERDDERRAAVGDERQGNPGQRREPEHRREIDHRLAAHERHEADREALAERVLAPQRNAQAGVGERSERGDARRHADEAELLADDAEDHVGVGLRQVVDLHDALAQPRAEHAAGPQADQRLNRLEPGPLRVLPWVEEAEHARAPVRLEPDRDEAERDDDAGPER